MPHARGMAPLSGITPDRGVLRPAGCLEEGATADLEHLVAHGPAALGADAVHAGRTLPHGLCRRRRR